MLVSSAANNFVFKVIFKDVTCNNSFHCELNLIIKIMFVLLFLNLNVKDISNMFISNWLL